MTEFNWGVTSDWYRSTIKKELFDEKLYNSFFQIEEGNVIVDVGASIGPFLFSIFDKKPGKCFAIEPFPENLPTLFSNCIGQPVVIIPKAISDEEYINIFWENQNIKVACQKFKDFIDENKIEKIDFLKIDCEGGEYDIFKSDNIEWILENIKYCVGEWHLADKNLKEKFRYVRDNFFHLFKRIEVQSVDGYDIKWDLYNEHFLEYYTEVIIHIEI
jgi:FkbM family methyltransferase